MPDNDPIIIGQANTAGNPGNETSLSRNESTNETVFVVRNLNAGNGIRVQTGGSGAGLWSTSGNGYGVLGSSKNGHGVRGDSTSLSGILGHASGTQPAISGTNYGVGDGVAGRNDTSVGVRGASISGVGVRGIASATPACEAPAPAATAFLASAVPVA